MRERCESCIGYCDEKFVLTAEGIEEKAQEVGDAVSIIGEALPTIAGDWVELAGRNYDRWFSALQGGLNNIGCTLTEEEIVARLRSEQERYVQES